jgi:tripartite-type tricarboxylate transporter receptor subunit TctC
LGGHIGLNFSSIPPVLQHIKSGRLLALAISSSRRSSQLPEVPTIAESGVTGYEFISWFGMFAPAKTPMPIIDQLNAALVRIVNTPEMRKQFETLGADPIGNSPEAFSAFIRRELEKNAKVVKLAGLKVD